MGQGAGTYAAAAAVTLGAAGRGAYVPLIWFGCPLGGLAVVGTVGATAGTAAAGAH